MIVNAKTAGLLALLGGVALFSTVEVAVKMMGKNALPFPMVFIRFFTTGLILLALNLPEFLKSGLALKIPDFGLFALNGFIGIAFSLSLFHLAILVFEKAASCAVVFSANPIFVIILARFVNGEPWSRSKWAALALGLAGVIFFAWESGAFSRQSLAALGLMTLAAIAFALSICISRRLVARYGVFIFMGFSALFGSLMVLPFALASVCRNGPEGLAQAWLPVLYITLAGTTLAYGLYYYGLRHCTAFQASMMFFLKPVLASVFAAAILNERINFFMILGSLLIVSGLVVTVSSHLKSRVAVMRLKQGNA